MNYLVLYKGHDTRRTLIGISHQQPLRIQRTLLPGQRHRLKQTTSLHTWTCKCVSTTMFGCLRYRA